MITWAGGAVAGIEDPRTLPEAVVEAARFVVVVTVVGGVLPLLVIKAATIPPPAMISAPMIGASFVNDMSGPWLGSGAGMPGDGIFGAAAFTVERGAFAVLPSGASISSRFSSDTPTASHRQVGVRADTNKTLL